MQVSPAPAGATTSAGSARSRTCSSRTGCWRRRRSRRGSHRARAARRARAPRPRPLTGRLRRDHGRSRHRVACRPRARHAGRVRLTRRCVRERRGRADRAPEPVSRRVPEPRGARHLQQLPPEGGPGRRGPAAGERRRCSLQRVRARRGGRSEDPARRERHRLPAQPAERALPQRPDGGARGPRSRCAPPDGRERQQRDQFYRSRRIRTRPPSARRARPGGRDPWEADEKHETYFEILSTWTAEVADAARVLARLDLRTAAG